MSRRITARGRVEGVQAFEQSARALGPALGPVRVKVPQARDDGFLRLLLDSLDPGIAYALDFRHDSWRDPHVDRALAARGVVRVGVIDGAGAFRYLRERDPPYSEESLAALAARLVPALAGGVDVYCFFRHEDEPSAPRYAERLAELVAAG